MKIKTLNLYAFGKFENTTIELSDGFNLIFGPNEAGKSTIQAFIEGMLFGFYKPYRKRRTYSDDYKRYKPINNDKYYGAMIIVDDSGREIRIERDFLQERDGVRIFDNLTGEDITTTYPYDATTKQYLPLGYDGVNASIYNNTVNFKQMASYSDEALAKEVNNRLVDMASDNGGDVSVSGVLDYLEEQKKEIGTFRRSRSNYGLAVRKKQRLEEALTEAEQNDSRIRVNQKRILQYEKNLARYEKKKSDRIAERKDEERAAVDAQKRRVDAVREEGETLAEKRRELLKTSDYYDADTYDHLRYLNRSGESLEKQRDTLEKEIDDVKNAGRKTKRSYEALKDKLKPYDKQQVKADWNIYLSAVGKRQQIISQVGEDETPKQNPKKHKNHKRSQTPAQADSDFANSRLVDIVLSYGRPPFIVMIALGAMMLLLGFINPAAYFVFAAQVVLIAAGLFLAIGGAFGNIIVSKYDDVVDDSPGIFETDDADAFTLDVDDDDDFDEFAVFDDDDDLTDNVDRDAIAEEISEEEDTEETIAALLEVYGERNEAAFERLMKRLKKGFAELDALHQKLSDDSVRLKSLKKQRADLDRQMTKTAQDIKDILEPLGITSIDDYAKGGKLKDALTELDAKIAANKELLDSMSGADYAKMPASDRLLHRSQDDMSEKTLDHSINTIKHEIASLEGQNQTLASGSETPVALREQIDALDAQIQHYEDEIKAIDMAESFFKRYQKRSHQMQAGDLNERIGDILSKITHRYHEVRVDDKLNVRVVSPSTGTLIGMDQLSGGTIDQIYFALRFGVRDLLDTHQSLPFVLDDPFVQYDDTRKKAALTFLNEMSQTDQILLFTCSSDEKRIMDAEGIHYIGMALV